ncbi:MAG TPA: hypothetical protein VIS74_00665 [Chthoniobacterales bacterium]
MKLFPPALLLVLLMSGCSALNEMQAAQTGRTLSASGFRALPANTPERAASLARLKPYQINRKTRSGAVYYLYPDPQQGILFVGDQSQYTAYQGYATQAAGDENRRIDELYAADTLGWADWKIWGEAW